MGTTLDLLPDLLQGHNGARLEARADGTRIEAPQALLVANNPYGMGDVAGLGRRARLDGGILGSRAGQKQDADESGGWAEIHHGVDRNFAQCTPTGLVVCESKGFPASSIRRLFVL